jgi:hypothetical protein
MSDTGPRHSNGDHTRFKWGIGAFVIVFTLILILGTIKDMAG